MTTTFACSQTMTMRVSRFRDRKSTRLNSSHTEIYTLSLHDALPISGDLTCPQPLVDVPLENHDDDFRMLADDDHARFALSRSEEHTSELQSHRDLHSFPTRRSSDLGRSHVSPAARRRTTRKS